MKFLTAFAKGSSVVMVLALGYIGVLRFTEWRWLDLGAPPSYLYMGIMAGLMAAILARQLSYRMSLVVSFFTVYGGVGVGIVLIAPAMGWGMEGFFLVLVAWLPIAIGCHVGASRGLAKRTKASDTVTA